MLKNLITCHSFSSLLAKKTGLRELNECCIQMDLDMYGKISMSKMKMNFSPLLHGALKISFCNIGLKILKILLSWCYINNSNNPSLATAMSITLTLLIYENLEMLWQLLSLDR